MSDEKARPAGQSGKSAEQAARDYDSLHRGDAGSQLPMMDFSMFVFSLNSSALVHLGVLDDPSTGEKARNLPAAKQTIDILGMLDEKTRGNLTKDEQDMLRHILHDLRIIYVKEKR